MKTITPNLWFDDKAEEAANYYVSIFRDARLGEISRYGEAGSQVSGMPAGSVMTVTFELNGQQFTALNGGPVFTFSEAVSFAVDCDDQEEVDHYWERLSEGGDEQAQQCGWLKDKYGLSWQIVPSVLSELLNDKDPHKAERVMAALLQMKKPDIDGLRRAYEGDDNDHKGGVA